MEIIFFYSLNSQKCQNIMSLIQRNQINVTLFCVDSKQSRDQIKNGHLFKIRGVPTIVVVYGQEAEIYEGEKVLQWFDELLQTRAKSNYDQDTPQSQTASQYDDYDYLVADRYSDAPSQGPSQHNEQPQYETSVPKPNRNSKERQMDSIKNIAKQMEEERKRSLGYDEDQLPHF